MKKIIFLILILALLTSCKKESPQDIFEKIRQNNINNAKSDFERECYMNNDGWMPMMPMKNGVRISEEPCLGCMPDRQNHICDFEDYKQFTGAN